MKRIILVFLIVVFLSFSLGIGISVGSGSFAKVKEVTGEVSIIRIEESKKAEKGMDLLKDDTIKSYENASITILFDKGITGTVAGDKKVELNDLYVRSKLDALKTNIKKPEADSAPAELNVGTVGGARGTEEGEKKAKSLKNDHYWNEKVD